MTGLKPPIGAAIAAKIKTWNFIPTFAVPIES